MNTQTAFGEVIKTNLNSAIVHAWKLDTFATFGELVLIASSTNDYLGIVTHVTSEPIDSTRTITPFQQTHSELEKEQPHIFHFLKTTTNCLLLGSKPTASPVFSFTNLKTPPPLHAFAYQADDTAYNNFFNDERGIAQLMRITEPLNTTDDLCLALLEHMAHKTILTPDISESIARALTSHINDDYIRLQSMCSRIEALENYQKAP